MSATGYGTYGSYPVGPSLPERHVQRSCELCGWTATGPLPDVISRVGEHGVRAHGEVLVRVEEALQGGPE